MAKSALIEDIERSTEFLDQVNNIAAADNKVTLLTYLSHEGKKSQLRHSLCAHVHMVACNAP